MISTWLTTSGTDRLTLWLERSLFVTVLLACALALSPGFADPDFWGHVQYGRDALNEGLPATATYAYTAEGFPWINHENICEYLMAWGVNMPGPGGMLVVKNLLGIGVMLLIYRQAVRQGVAQAPVYLSMLLVAVNLMPCWSLRPQLMTYTLFTLMIVLFDWCFVDWHTPWRAFLGETQADDVDETARAEYRKRWPWLLLLVPMFVIWTNSHGGFVAGFCTMGAYLGGRSVEALARYRRRGLPMVAWLGAIVLACGLATFINPYGADLHRWLLRALDVPPPEIMEWNPPKLLSLVWSTWWIMMGVSFAALIMTRRPRDLVQMALLGLTMWQSCEYRRHIAFYAILFGFWMPVHVDSWLSRMRSKRAHEITFSHLSPRVRWAMLGVLLLGMGLLGCTLFFRLRYIPVRMADYPVSAFQYITDRNLHGNMVVKMKWAQYAVAAFGPSSTERPQLKVAFDGRFDTCYPQEVLDMYFDFEIGDAPLTMRYRGPDSPPVDGGRILEYRNPNLVLIDRANRYSVNVMCQHRDRWALLYQDSIAQLWGRRDIYENAQHPDNLAPETRVIGDARQEGVVPWPALPRRQAAPPRMAGVDGG
jgi:hypothetical protein